MTTVAAVVLALVISTLAAVFLTEFAPPAVRRALDPVIRLLAGVPSVIYGLIGILAIAPWINEHLLSNSPQAVRDLRRAAQRREPDDGHADPDRDDPADHGRDHAPTR